MARFIQWILKVVRAIEHHKQDETVQEQRRRSGEAPFQSGLTKEEKNLRSARAVARATYDHGAKLNRRLAWEDMSEEQQWYVREYQNGKLWRDKEAAERAYKPRSAETHEFRMELAAPQDISAVMETPADGAACAAEQVNVCVECRGLR